MLLIAVTLLFMIGAVVPLLIVPIWQLAIYPLFIRTRTLPSYAAGQEALVESLVIRRRCDSHPDSHRFISWQLI